jgi:hypothetical protein
VWGGVVLVGDAAENPARSTAGRPQLRGLTDRRAVHAPQRSPSQWPLFRCPASLAVRSGCSRLGAGDAWAGRRDLCSNGALELEMLRDEAAADGRECRLSGAVPRDGWWRSLGRPHALPRAAASTQSKFTSGLGVVGSVSARWHGGGPACAPSLDRAASASSRPFRALRAQSPAADWVSRRACGRPGRGEEQGQAPMPLRCRSNARKRAARHSHLTRPRPHDEAARHSRSEGLSLCPRMPLLFSCTQLLAGAGLRATQRAPIFALRAVLRHRLGSR